MSGSTAPPPGPTTPQTRSAPACATLHRRDDIGGASPRDRAASGCNRHMGGVESQPEAARRARDWRRRVRWGIALLVGATIAVFAAPSEAAVRVVVRTPRPIWELTASGDRIAWIQFGACRNGYSVFRINLRTGHQARLTSCFAPVNAPVDFALAGVRTMWSQSFGFRHVTVSTVL